MKPIDLLKPYRDTNEFTIEELVAVASSLLEKWAPRQPRYKVVAYPDVRTVRFYGAQRLIDPPTKRMGNRVLYTYHHLLQIIVLKVLQAQYIPLRAVRRMIEGKSVKELESLLDSVLNSRHEPVVTGMAEAAGHDMKGPHVSWLNSSPTGDPYAAPVTLDRFPITEWMEVTVIREAARAQNATELNRLAELVKLAMQKAYDPAKERRSPIKQKKAG